MIRRLKSGEYRLYSRKKNPKTGKRRNLGTVQNSTKPRAKSKKTKRSERWIAEVKTDSTHPPEGIFTRSAATIARTLGSKKVSPKGPASGLRMITYFINRAGKGLSAGRRAELEKAKLLLSKRVQRRKG